MRPGGTCQTVEGGDAVTVIECRQLLDAGARDDAVDQHGASAALGDPAAKLRPFEPKQVAQDIEQRLGAVIDRDRVCRAVDRERACDWCRHTDPTPSMSEFDGISMEG